MKESKSKQTEIGKLISVHIQKGVLDESKSRTKLLC